MTYRANTGELLFTLNDVLGAGRLAQTELFAEATGETVEAILGEAGKLCEDVLGPINRNGDLHPAKLENGVVRCSPGFKEGYDAIAEGGWVGMSALEESGGMGLPMTVTSAVNEMMAASCLSLSLNPLMTQGQIEALEHHASDELKALYLPKLVSGEWNGTMNLTEPQAGSDVGALRSKAEPNGDGTYAISGQKIFISWGDHDLTGNICHLVLARLPDGVPGTKGISLFLVPKFLPDKNGNPGVANTLKPISLEHKLGLHGSPTAVMEYDRATGWLVGQEHGGMATMFVMMNNARLGVGVQGLGIAEAATQKALAYAMDRKQGRTPVEGTGTIVDHADVRRMLMSMKVQTQVARAICLDCALSLDMSRATGDAAWTARGALLTPIAKSFGTDAGNDVAQLGVQVHGGMGFIEETGAAQYARDVRVTSIYEGTNGIQAMDLVARKMMDGGAAARALLEEVEATAAAAPEALAKPLNRAAEAMRAATDWLVGAQMNDRFAGAVAYQRAFALTLGGHYQARAALADPARLPLARFFAAQFLTQVPGLLIGAMQGAEVLYELDPEALGV